MCAFTEDIGIIENVFTLDIFTIVIKKIKLIGALKYNSCNVSSNQK